MKKNNNSSKFNHDRMQQTMLIVLANALHKQAYNPIFQYATFTDIQLNKDYSLAKVYVDSYIQQNIDKIIIQLNTAKGFFKTCLAKQLTIRKIPDLIFLKDKTIEQTEKIDNLLTKIKHK